MKKVTINVLTMLAIVLIISIIGLESASASWEEGISDTVPAQAEVEKNESDTEEEFAKEVISLINSEREKLGVAALERHETLKTAAITRAKEASEKFAHVRPDGSSVSTVFKENELGYKHAGETLAGGAKTSSGLVTAWMNSEIHKKVIMDAKFTNADLGIFQREDGRLYFSLLLMTPAE